MRTAALPTLPTPNGTASSPTYRPLKGVGDRESTASARYPRRRHLLRTQERLPVAALALWLPALGDRLPLLQTMEPRRHLGTGEPDDPRVPAR
jgi:hypothetical protein